MKDSKFEHLEYQKKYFNTNCDFFRQPIPEEIEERTRTIVARAKLSPSSRVLDVGTGIGVLIKHFIAAGVPDLQVTGCDLSENMLAEAKKRYPQTTFWQGDFLDFPADQLFDAVFFNACFGNFFDRDKTVEKACSLLKPGGRVIISHPLGNRFVRQLQEQDPHLIAALLPDRNKLEDWSAKLPLVIADFEDSADLYLAILEKAK